MSPERRFNVWWSSVAGLGWVSAAGLLALSWNRLPEPLATHFGSSGAPDGSMSRVGFLLLLTGQVMLSLLVTAPRRPSGERRVAGAPARLALVTFMSGLAATASAFTITHNWERSTWAEAGPIGVLSMLAMLVPPLVASGVLFVLARRWWPPAYGSALPADEVVPLEPGARASWSGGASNRWLLAVGVLLAIEGALLFLILSEGRGVSLVVLAVHAIVMVLLEHFSKIRVMIDARTLTIAYGSLGWIKQRIPLDRIERAAAFELEPWDHGGWGYRGSFRFGRRAAVVVRAGPALRLHLRDGKQLCITVDGAAAAAGLINALAQRRAPAPPVTPATDLPELGASS